MSDDLFAALTSTPAVRDATSGAAWAQAMLDAEAALARACATAGLIPGSAAESIGAACRVDRFDLADIAARTDRGGNPAIPLVAQLRALVGDEAGRYVHWGATSQDIVDTAMVLVIRRAGALVAADMETVAREAARLADLHRGTVMVARTLLQQAAPTTFGLKAAGWAAASIDAQHAVRRTIARLPAQLGGPVGTLAAFGDRALEVVTAFAADLQLPEAPVPWHTARGRLVEAACALAIAAGVCDKVATDVGLLAQTEVGEAHEAALPGHGASSSLPHKKNPVGVAAVRAAARRARAQVPVVLGAMAQEHERALGAWQSEWPAITDLLLASGAAASRAGELLAGLRVDPARMARNLGAMNGLAVSEGVVSALAPALGRPRAMAIVEAAARTTTAAGTSLRDEVMAQPEVRAALEESAVDELFDPASHLGVADQLVDRVIARLDEGRP